MKQKRKYKTKCSNRKGDSWHTVLLLYMQIKINTAKSVSSVPPPPLLLLLHPTPHPPLSLSLFPSLSLSPPPPPPLSATHFIDFSCSSGSLYCFAFLFPGEPAYRLVFSKHLLKHLCLVSCPHLKWAITIQNPYEECDSCSPSYQSSPPCRF